MVDIILAVIVNLFLWIYLFYCLNGAKKIEYECKSGSKIVIFILFIGLGILVWYRLQNIYGVISLASFLLASGVYHIIPSGFGKDCVVVMGRVYPFKMIEDMELRKENQQLILSFTYKRKPHLLFATLEQTDFMKAYFDLYLKQRIKGGKI